MDALLIFLSGLLDRVRGDRFHFLGLRAVDKLAYGWVVAAILGHPLDVVTLAFVLAFGIGMSFGWGCPMGAFLGDKKMQPHDLEWWQVGILKTNVDAAVWARGLLWAAPILPVAHFLDESVLCAAIASAIAFPLALYIVRPLKLKEAWEVSEYVRGWLVGGTTAFLVWIGVP